MARIRLSTLKTKKEKNCTFAVCLKEIDRFTNRKEIKKEFLVGLGYCCEFSSLLFQNLEKEEMKMEGGVREKE